MVSVESLYPDPQLLSREDHPETGEPVEFMTLQSFLTTGERLFEQVIGYDADTVIVLESGAEQIASLFEKLAKLEDQDLDLIRLKVSREYPSKFWSSRKLSGLESVTIVDEYIDSGQTLLNAIKKIQEFSPEVKINVVSYGWFSDRDELAGIERFSLYKKSDLLYWEEFGAYPFENRIDLVGHFFVPLKDQLRCQRTESLCASSTVSQEAERFLEKLKEELSNLDTELTQQNLRQ